MSNTVVVYHSATATRSGWRKPSRTVRAERFTAIDSDGNLSDDGWAALDAG